MKVHPKNGSIEQLESRVLFAKTIFVDANAPVAGTHNGSSWQNAFFDLVPALAAATAGDEIRVANGHYKPGTTRWASYVLRNGVSVMGGYAGYGATNPDGRNIEANLTTLSGEIGSAGSTDNTYSVVTASGLDLTTIIDGFIIADGNALDGGDSSRGGGIEVRSSALVIRNCTFIGNVARDGGAISVDGSSLTITDSVFRKNHAGLATPTRSIGAGGAIYSLGSKALKVARCTFIENSADAEGGAIHINTPALAPIIEISECSFVNNRGSEGGALWLKEGSISIVSSSFEQNGATLGGAVRVATRSNLTIEDCRFSLCSADRGGAVYADGNSSLWCLDSVFQNNSAALEGGAIAVSTGTSTIEITRCDFDANSTTQNSSRGGALHVSVLRLDVPKSTTTVTDCSFTSGFSRGQGGGIYLDGKQDVSLVRCEFVGNEAITRGGGVMLSSSGEKTLLSLCIFRGNSSSDGGGLFTSDDGRIESCTFADNVAGSGAALSDNSVGTLLINSVLRGNEAGAYGVLQLSYAVNAMVVNCTIVGNSGTVVYSSYASGSFTNCTIVGNVGAAFVPLGQPSVSFTNCILWNNIDGFRKPIKSVEPIDVTYSVVEFGYPGTGNLDVNPQFLDGDGADNIYGTADDDLRLFPGSPAADSGSNAAARLVAITADAAGGSRYVDIPSQPDVGVAGGAGGNVIVDMGAYEAQPVLVARVAGPYRVLAGAKIKVEGLGASDVAGPLSYAWDLDNDGQYDDGTGSNLDFSAAGRIGWSTAPIAVRLTDAMGRSTTSTSTVTILPQTLYVDDSAPAGGDGASWNGAYRDLSSALAHQIEGMRIQVAQGVYKPGSGTDRVQTFTLGSDVSLYGGFAGYGAENPDVRDVKAFPTTLSGDVGIAGESNDNASIVVKVWQTDSPSVIDGFAITAAGGVSGLYAFETNVTVRNCRFFDNWGRQGSAVFSDRSNLNLIDCSFVSNLGYSNGGAIYGEGAAASISAIRCVFTRNTALEAGALSWAGVATLRDCTFNGNTASAAYASGGAAKITGQSSILNCVFVGNRITPLGANGTGGAVYLNGSLIAGCTFVANEANGSGGAIRASNLTLRNSIVWGNLQSGTGIHTTSANFSHNNIQNGPAGDRGISTDPKFLRNPHAGADGVWGTSDDDYGDLRLAVDSPCVDAGSNSLVPEGVVVDLGGNPRFVDVAGVKDPGVNVDMGAFERGAPLAVTAGIFTGSAGGPALRLSFSANMQADSIRPSDLVLTDLSTGFPLELALSPWAATYESSTSAANWTLPITLPEGNYRASISVGAVADAAGTPLESTYSFTFFVLGGDANRDRRVDQTDLGALSTHWNTSGRALHQGDFNYDGRVDGGDLNILTRNWLKVLAAPGPAPVGPGALTAVRSGEKVDLKWADRSDSETGFVIERKTGASGTWDLLASVGANVQTYADLTVAGGNTYYYRVYTNSLDNVSDYSNEATATVPVPVPTSPSGLSAVRSGTQVNLTWTDSSNNETGFIVERKTGVGGTWGELAQVAAGARAYSDTTAAAGFTYYYRVNATNSAGNSGYSNEASIAVPTPTVTTYVSDLNWTSMTNAWGPAEKDKSNGEQAAGDGRTITLNGVTYAKGIGVHASASMTYALSGNYTRFLSDIGIDDESGNNGSVVFQVYLDNVLSFTSSTMTGASATQQVNLNATGKQTLRLVVTDAGNGNSFDHADWAGARLESGGTVTAAAPATVLDPGKAARGRPTPKRVASLVLSGDA